jgi:N-acetylmuramoyl-L-alanine amidase
MREITHIVIHCSATPEGRHHTVDKWHKARGFVCIGYHYVILLDGRVELGRPVSQPGAHVAGHNEKTIGVCYIGGIDANTFKPKDTRTPEQKFAMAVLVKTLKNVFPNAAVVGHRDMPGANKACPCFDVAKWWSSV